MNLEVLDLLEESVQELFLPIAKSLQELKSPNADDPNELLKRRFLCRGGGMTLLGPTGIGKSTLTLQMAVSWCLGRGCFGIEPARPVKILHIQAENDEGDLAEMRDGIFAHLNLTEEDVLATGQNYQTVMVDSHSGLDFCENILKPLVRKHLPDLIIIDPALSYLGGETNNQQQVGEFLRGGINPILHEYKCGLLVVHHTNKPPSGSQRPDWAGGDFAYLGSGSAEWANWPRACIALRSTGSSEIFELRLAKRGIRAGWRDNSGSSLLTKNIRHSRIAGQICWDDVTAEEAATIKALESQAKGRKPAIHETNITSLIPEKGSISKIELKAMLLSANFSHRGIDDQFKLLEDQEKIVRVEVRRKTGPAAVHFRLPEVQELVTNAENTVCD